MRSFIALEGGLDVLNRGSATNFDFLAGTNFDAAFAAGLNNMSYLPPSPNTDALFMKEPEFSLTDSMLMLNEDFAEFGLAPMNVNVSSSSSAGIASTLESRGRLPSALIDGLLFYERQNSDFLNDLNQISGARGLVSSLSDDERFQSIDDFSSLLARYDINFNTDYNQTKPLINVGAGLDTKRKEASYATDLLKAFGLGYGANLAGELMSGSFSKNTLMTATAKDVIDIGANYIQKALGGALSKGGALSLGASLGVAAAGWAFKELATEIYEMISGEDISFGWGGEMIGEDVYTQSRGFFEGFGDTSFGYTTNRNGVANGIYSGKNFARWDNDAGAYIHARTGQRYSGDLPMNTFLNTGVNRFSDALTRYGPQFDVNRFNTLVPNFSTDLNSSFSYGGTLTAMSMPSLQSLRATAWSNQTPNINLGYAGTLSNIVFAQSFQSYRTFEAPMNAETRAAKLALQNYGYTYNKSKGYWQDSKGKEVDMQSVPDSTRRELAAFEREFTGQQLNSSADDKDFEYLRNCMQNLGAVMYWEVTQWGEIRPIIPLIDLEPWEIENAFSFLAAALELYGVRQPFDPAAISRQVDQIMAAQMQRMQYLLGTYDQWVKKPKRGKRGKGETYPIVYL